MDNSKGVIWDFSKIPPKNYNNNNNNNEKRKKSLELSPRTMSESQSTFYETLPAGYFLYVVLKEKK